MKKVYVSVGKSCEPQAGFEPASRGRLRKYDSLYAIQQSITSTPLQQWRWCNGKAFLCCSCDPGSNLSVRFVLDSLTSQSKSVDETCESMSRMRGRNFNPFAFLWRIKFTFRFHFHLRFCPLSSCRSRIAQLFHLLSSWRQ